MRKFLISSIHAMMLLAFVLIFLHMFYHGLTVHWTLAGVACQFLLIALICHALSSLMQQSDHMKGGKFSLVLPYLSSIFLIAFVIMFFLWRLQVDSSITPQHDVITLWWNEVKSVF